MSRPRRLSIAIAALGGQGGGVLADWLVETAESQDWWAQSTSVPGVAQRTGTTIYYVEICERSAADGARPVLALMPTPGDVDLVIAAEWVEAGRAMLRGLVTPQRTTLVASSHRIYSIAEKSVPGDGIVDAGAVLAAARAEAHRLVMFDMEAVAAAQGTVVSAVLLGAAAASGALPFPRAAYEQAIHRAGIAVAGSLRGFAAGFERASTAPASATDGTAATKDATGAPADAVVLPGDLDRRIEAALPAEARALARAGVRRLIDYQDKAYASFYLDRLEKIAALERALPVSAHERAGHESPSAAVARYLALWMSYEDVIRVADLKTRAARFDRVRREARAAASELVEVEEYMHPRVEEICDTLPAWLGRRVLATGWMRRVLERFTRHGRRVRSSSLPGFLLLHAIGGLRRLRRGTLRYSVEQARIESWLSLIAQVLPRDPALASEIAECQRLVKGYGETHARGLARFEAIIAAAVSAPPGVATAQTVRDSRRAALDSI